MRKFSWVELIEATKTVKWDDIPKNIRHNIHDTLENFGSGSPGGSKNSIRRSIHGDGSDVRFNSDESINVSYGGNRYSGQLGPRPSSQGSNISVNASKKELYEQALAHGFTPSQAEEHAEIFHKSSVYSDEKFKDMSDTILANKARKVAEIAEDARLTAEHESSMKKLLAEEAKTMAKFKAVVIVVGLGTAAALALKSWHDRNKLATEQELLNKAKEIHQTHSKKESNQQERGLPTMQNRDYSYSESFGQSSARDPQWSDGKNMVGWWELGAPRLRENINEYVSKLENEAHPHGPERSGNYTGSAYIKDSSGNVYHKGTMLTDLGDNAAEAAKNAQRAAAEKAAQTYKNLSPMAAAEQEAAKGASKFGGHSLKVIGLLGLAGGAAAALKIWHDRYPHATEEEVHAEGMRLKDSHSKKESPWTGRARSLAEYQAEDFYPSHEAQKNYNLKESIPESLGRGLSQFVQEYPHLTGGIIGGGLGILAIISLGAAAVVLMMAEAGITLTLESANLLIKKVKRENLKTDAEILEAARDIQRTKNKIVDEKHADSRSWWTGRKK